MLKIPLKKTECLFKTLTGQWFEEAKLEGERFMLSKDEVFQVDGKKHSGKIPENIRSVQRELFFIFDYEFYDVITIKEGDQTGLTFLLDFPDCKLPFSIRHTIMRASLPNLQSVLKYNYDPRLSVLPCMLPGGRIGQLYEDTKKGHPFLKGIPISGVVLKNSNQVNRLDSFENLNDYDDWFSVSFRQY